MTRCERTKQTRDTALRHTPRPIGQTDPRIAEQQNQDADLRGSPDLDDRQVSPIGEEADVQYQSHAAATANVDDWPRARRSTRPLLPRFESRLAARRLDAPIDLFGSRAAEHLMRAMAVVPLDVQRQLASEAITPVRGQQPARTLVLDRANQSFDHYP